MCVTTCHLYDECPHHQRVLTLCEERREKRLRTYHAQLAQLAQQQQQQRPHTNKPRSRSLWSSLFGALSPSPQPIPRPLLRPATAFTFVSQQPPKTATQHSCRSSKIQQKTAVHPTACPNCEAVRRMAQRAAQPGPQVGRQYYPRNAPLPVQMNPAPAPRAPPALRREVRRLPAQQATSSRADKPLPALPSSRYVRQDATLSPALLGQAFALAPAGEFYDMYPPTHMTASNPMPRRPQQQMHHRSQQTHQRPQQMHQRPQQRQQLPPQQPSYHATHRRPLPQSNWPLPPPPMNPAVARRAVVHEPIARTPSPLSSTGSAWVRRPVSPLSPGTRASNFRYVSPPAPAWI